MEESTLPQSEMHLITIGNVLYKIKLFAKRDKNSTVEEEKKFWARRDVRHDMKRMITFILQHESRLFPIRSDTFIAYPYKKLWHKGQDLSYFRDNNRLNVSKFEFVLFLQNISNDPVHQEQLQSIAKNKNLRSNNTRSKRKHLSLESNYVGHNSSSGSTAKKSKKADCDRGKKDQLPGALEADNVQVENATISNEKICDTAIRQSADDSCSSSSTVGDEDNNTGSNRNIVTTALACDEATEENKVSNDDNSSLIDADIGRIEQLANRNYKLHKDRGNTNESTGSFLMAFFNRFTYS
ncbi:uncharacterized protein TRIADDRAFT_53306 [Trichoplax adhaerens]|uniref:Uncharacterized protein n=1 Tax=Trichoplax adhaerens TaxID=10228 RepID=B3RNV7_TRIAD|nr:predicted protein [Trichoplax adhaerens]EDV28080.1 predicted protein [Trichoplax adhaerens]|eukprot:XP_002109914.1 predicted protein [Trichoplax adhaerens]